MISWIVATHDPMILYRHFLASLTTAVDELVVVEGAPSIAAAYNEGQSRATRPVRCYVHHDVQILDLPRLRAELLEHTPGRGMVGVVGSRTDVLPWWDGEMCGSVFDQRIGHLDNGPGGECAVLDGLLLATAQTVKWDESIPGWHGYDYDMCRQMTDRGLINFCLTGGKEMVRHNTTSGRDPDHLTGWADALAVLRLKWG